MKLHLLIVLISLVCFSCEKGSDSVEDGFENENNNNNQTHKKNKILIFSPNQNDLNKEHIIVINDKDNESDLIIHSNYSINDSLFVLNYIDKNNDATFVIEQDRIIQIKNRSNDNFSLFEIEQFDSLLAIREYDYDYTSNSLLLTNEYFEEFISDNNDELLRSSDNLNDIEKDINDNFITRALEIIKKALDDHIIIMKIFKLDPFDLNENSKDNFKTTLNNAHEAIKNNKITDYDNYEAEDKNTFISITNNFEDFKSNFNQTFQPVYENFITYLKRLYEFIKLDIETRGKKPVIEDIYITNNTGYSADINILTKESVEKVETIKIQFVDYANIEIKNSNSNSSLFSEKISILKDKTYKCIVIAQNKYGSSNPRPFKFSSQVGIFANTKFYKTAWYVELPINGISEAYYDIAGYYTIPNFKAEKSITEHNTYDKLNIYFHEDFISVYPLDFMSSRFVSSSINRGFSLSNDNILKINENNYKFVKYNGMINGSDEVGHTIWEFSINSQNNLIISYDELGGCVYSYRNNSDGFVHNKRINSITIVNLGTSVTSKPIPYQ